MGAGAGRWRVENQDRKCTRLASARRGNKPRACGREKHFLFARAGLGRRAVWGPGATFGSVLGQLGPWVLPLQQPKPHRPHRTLPPRRPRPKTPSPSQSLPNHPHASDRLVLNPSSLSVFLDQQQQNGLRRKLQWKVWDPNRNGGAAGGWVGLGPPVTPAPAVGDGRGQGKGPHCGEPCGASPPAPPPGTRKPCGADAERVLPAAGESSVTCPRELGIRGLLGALEEAGVHGLGDEGRGPGE